MEEVKFTKKGPNVNTSRNSICFCNVEALAP